MARWKQHLEVQGGAPCLLTYLLGTPEVHSGIFNLHLQSLQTLEVITGIHTSIAAAIGGIQRLPMASQLSEVVARLLARLDGCHCCKGLQLYKKERALFLTNPVLSEAVTTPVLSHGLVPCVCLSFGSKSGLLHLLFPAFVRSPGRRHRRLLSRLPWPDVRCSLAD